MTLVIHIAGTQGSGKSTLGQQLAKLYKDKITVFELDTIIHLMDNPTEYKKQIKKIITDSKKPIIFTGLNARMCLGEMTDSDVFFPIKTKHLYYISSSEETIRQRFYRQLDKLQDRKETLFNEWLNNPEKIQEKLYRFVSLEKWVENNSKCDELYKIKKYKFLSQKEIFQNVCGLLN